MELIRLVLRHPFFITRGGLKSVHPPVFPPPRLFAFLTCRQTHCVYLRVRANTHTHTHRRRGRRKVHFRDKEAQRDARGFLDRTGNRELQGDDDQWKEFSSLPPGNREGLGETALGNKLTPNSWGING